MRLDDDTLPFVDLVGTTSGSCRRWWTIAYRREHPELNDEQVETVIDGTNRLETVHGAARHRG